MLRVHCAVLNARTRRFVTRSQSYGGHGERETPGNIPNPEAKPLSADGTALETGWESRTPPDILSEMGVGAFAPAPVLVCPAHFSAPILAHAPPTDEVPRRHDCSATRLRRLPVPTGWLAGRRLSRRRPWSLGRSRRRRTRWHAARRHTPRWLCGSSRAAIRASGRH